MNTKETCHSARSITALGTFAWLEAIENSDTIASQNLIPSHSIDWMQEVSYPEFIQPESPLNLTLGQLLVDSSDCFGLLNTVEGLVSGEWLTFVSCLDLKSGMQSVHCAYSCTLSFGMAHRQSLGAASTLSTLRGLPAYNSRAPSIAGSQAPSTLPPPFSDTGSIAPSYNTNASAIINIWDLQPLESNPDIYEFAIGAGSDPEDRPWLKWTVLARSSDKQFSKPDYPRYVGGDDVACVVSLNLPEPKHMSSITVMLRGKYVTSSLQGAEGDYIFLKTLKSVDISGVRQRDGMLAAGNYKYEIRFPFPAEVDLLEMAQETVKGKAPRLPNTPQAVFSSPQTTRDRLATVDYDLSLIVEHGKLFKRSAKLRTRVLYIPSIVPDPPSILRQIAYRDCVWAPEPARDPTGWVSISPLVLRGDFEGKEEVVKYTVFLANPLSYTRGTFVPVHLDIACENLRLLEALSKRECHDIHLACESSALLRAEHEVPKYLKAVTAQASGKEVSTSNSRGYTFPSERMQNVVESVSKVCFARDAPVYRHLEKSWPSISLKGEIHLSRSLLPTTDFLPFSVQYKVKIDSPIDPSQRFAPATNTGASVPITIATHYALNVERPVKMLHCPPPTRREIQSGVDTTVNLMNRSQFSWVSSIGPGF